MTCTPAVLQRDYIFRDWLGAQQRRCHVLRPHCRQALVDWMTRQADIAGVRMHAVGAGHSTSAVARPLPGAGIAVVVDDLVIHPDEAAAAAGWLRANAVPAGEHLIRVPAGMSISALNQLLHRQGWALPNMGSYDAQTVGGAIATGTHGSGLVTGPLSDLVASIELVTVLRAPRVAALRVEPADGPTDPARFDGGRFGLELLQDTDAFESCVVGLGAFGIVTAITLRVRDAFWLEEERWMTSWPELSLGRVLLDLVEREPFVDLVMTALPYPTHARRNHRCLVTVRRPIPVPASAGASPPPPPPRRDARHADLERRLEDHRSAADPRRSLTHWLANLASDHPRLANYSAYQTLREDTQTSGFQSASHIVLRTSVGDLVLATSAEIAVPLERTVQAVEATIDHLADLHRDGYHHGSPVGIRFSDGSRHWASMHHGRRTCTIEAPILLGMRRDSHDASHSAADIAHMLERFTARLISIPALEARSHWGQFRVRERSHLRATYPRYADWERQLRRFNPYGIFDNEVVSAVVSLSPRRPSRLEEASWVHGYELEVEHPDHLERIWRAGFYARLQGQPGRETWLHIAVPTPVLVDDARLRPESVMVRYRAGSEETRLGAVHVYDGERRIAAHDDLAARSTGWQLQRFRVPDLPAVRWGLGVSIQVRFSDAPAAEARQLEISAVGCDFIE